MVKVSKHEFQYQIFEIRAKLTHLEAVAGSLFNVNHPDLTDTALSAKVLDQLAKELGDLRQQAADLSGFLKRALVL